MEVQMMRLHVSFCAAALATAFALSAQIRPDNSGRTATPRDARGGTYREGETAVPAARYSPLAAQGGYAGGRTSPLDAAVHALNPHDVNLGEIWDCLLYTSDAADE